MKCIYLRVVSKMTNGESYDKEEEEINPKMLTDHFKK